MEHSPRQLIVNADDLGRTLEINLGIEKAFREGIVSSTSFPANSVFFANGLEILSRNPDLGVGVHLHLNEYSPVSDNGFMSDISVMSMYALYRRLFFINKQNELWIEEEFRQQIEKLLKNKISISHVDGHNHMHAHPRVVEIVLKLAKEYSIPWMRMPHERLYNLENLARSAGQFVLNQVCRWDELVLKRRIRIPQGFYGISAHGKMSEAWLRKILQGLKPGVNEIMCHVGLDNDDPPYSIGFRWQDELKVYTKFNKQYLKDTYNIEVISFNNGE
jgi:predicted glycoside hydrolase/deacetylase ChbG (UPF0249 family)